MKQLLTTAQKNLQSDCFMVVKELKKSNGYIKGFGSKLDRLMTSDHSPVMNIKSSIRIELVSNGILHLKDLCYYPTDKINSITSVSQIDIKN